MTSRSPKSSKTGELSAAVCAVATSPIWNRRGAFPRRRHRELDMPFATELIETVPDQKIGLPDTSYSKARAIITPAQADAPVSTPPQIVSIATCWVVQSRSVA